MTNKTVVIFNAAPNTGKDVATDMLVSYFQSGVKLGFKDALYKDTADHFGIDVNDLIEYHSDRSLKEKPSLMFPKYGRESLKQYFFSLLYVIGAMINNSYLMSLGYYSSRNALTHVSEDLVKPEYGKDYYGKKLVETIEDSSERFHFVSDGGFDFEVVPLLEKGYNVYIVHLERNGATFDRDSRSLLNKDDFKEYNNIKLTAIDNNGSLDDLYKSITDFSFDLVLNQILPRYGGIKSEYEVIET